MTSQAVQCLQTPTSENTTLDAKELKKLFDVFFMCVLCLGNRGHVLILKVTTFIVNEMQLKHEEEEVEYCQLTTNRNHFSFAMFERGIGATGK